MNQKSEKEIGETPAGKKLKINRDITIFFFFIVISFTLWYLNSLRKEMEVKVKFPVYYINLPEDLIISDDPPGIVYLNLSAKGYTLLKIKSPFKKPYLDIDLSSIPLQKDWTDNYPDGYYLAANSLIPYFSRQLPSPEIKIVSVKPDTLFLVIRRNPYLNRQTN